MSQWEFVCPTGWKFLHKWGEGGFALVQIGGGLRVLIDCEVKSDGNEWIHVSCSAKSWTPTHEDMALVKREFIGDRYAYSVWPPESQYVNIHSHCLHLWARWTDDDGQVLPEFSEELPLIGRSI